MRTSLGCTARLRIAAGALALALMLPSSLALGQEAAALERRGTEVGAQFMRRAWSRMTEADREALFDAHLAAMHVGLRLTPDQDKLWPPLEAAMRASAQQTFERRRRRMSEGPPADPVAGLRRAADRARDTGAELGKIADAAQPLYVALTPDQKRRLPILLHGLRPQAPGPGPQAGPQPTAQPSGWGLPD